MATQRKSTGSTPLFDMITEVYDTKKRMKAVINKVIETDSDDFEEYATYAHNCIVTKWNLGWTYGYLDGFHAVFPDIEVPEEYYSDGFLEYATFTPSIPEYSTDTMTENLVIIMRDSLRCRLLLKDELETDSDEFVTYPDLLDELIVSKYNEAYSTAYEAGVTKALEIGGSTITIEQHYLSVEMTKNTSIGTIYYWFDFDSTKRLYTGQFTFNTRCIVYAALKIGNVYTSPVSKLLIIPNEEEYTVVYNTKIELPNNTKKIYFYAPLIGDNTDGTIEVSIDEGNWISPTSLTDNKHKFLVEEFPISKSGQYNFIHRIRMRHISNDTVNSKYRLFGVGLGTDSSYDSGFYYTEYEACGNPLSLYLHDSFNINDLNNFYSNPLINLTINENLWNMLSDASVNNLENLGLSPMILTDSCYYGMFQFCSNLVKPPKLPAITLAQDCYGWMFYGCTSLTTAPELPATTLRRKCYEFMFSHCTSLITAPALPAMSGSTDTLINEQYLSEYEEMFSVCTSLTTAPVFGSSGTNGSAPCCKAMFFGCTSLTTAPVLPFTIGSKYCYHQMFGSCTSLVNLPNNMIQTTSVGYLSCELMFEDCSSLVNAPELPATTLAAGCYHSMFSGCTSLVNGPSILPATTLPEFHYWGCYTGMFWGCTSLVNAPEISATTVTEHSCSSMFGGCTSLVNGPSILPATTLANYCYENMFSGCTSLTTAPVLPATTLAERCYQYMFENCTSLNYIKCLGVNRSARNCVYYWVYNVSANGTFVKASSATWATATSDNDYRGIPSGWTIVDDVA